MSGVAGEIAPLFEWDKCAERRVVCCVGVQSQLHISAIGSLPVLPRACAKEMMHVLDDVVKHAKSSTLPKGDQDSDYLLARGHEFTEVQDKGIREMLRRTMFRLGFIDMKLC